MFKLPELVNVTYVVDDCDDTGHTHGRSVCETVAFQVEEPLQDECQHHNLKKSHRCRNKENLRFLVFEHVPVHVEPAVVE